MDRPAKRVRRPWLSIAATLIIVFAVFLAPVAAVGTWLLLTDPGLAADTAASGDLWPLARAIVRMLGRAIFSLMTYL